MAIANTLTIKPVTTGQTDHYCFDCIGCIDANSESELDKLPALPPGSKVTLNFAEVERVNSMGLSLLLKLFEEWERNEIEIGVYQLNRMIKMLFKITGLGRFVQSGKPVAATGTAGGSTVTRSSEPAVMPSPAPPFHAGRPRAPEPESASSRSKLRFVASLQTGSQLSGWFLLNTFLQRRLQRAIHFEQFQVGQEIGENTADILFAKPFEACAAIEQNGFLPLMSPVDESDEVVILARANDKRDLGQLQRPRVVTATQGSFVYLLGRFLCDENGMDSEQFDFIFAKNEIKSLMTLIRSQADLLFMLKKTYDGLSSLSRKSVRIVDESATQLAFHLFCLAPHLEPIQDELEEVLMGMNADEQGQQILRDIQIQGWRKPETDELKLLSMVFNRYR